MKDLENRLADLLNEYSQENNSDTPDHILARYLMDCLTAYNRALQTREKWYKRPINNPTITFTNERTF